MTMATATTTTMAMVTATTTLVSSITWHSFGCFYYYNLYELQQFDLFKTLFRFQEATLVYVKIIGIGVIIQMAVQISKDVQIVMDPVVLGVEQPLMSVMNLSVMMLLVLLQDGFGAMQVLEN